MSKWDNPEVVHELVGSATINLLIDAIGPLLALDPAADTLEGQLLIDLADAMEKYEKAKYPDEPQWWKRR
jgi:hypothetical protein